jgi:hypothetical protein
MRTLILLALLASLAACGGPKYALMVQAGSHVQLHRGIHNATQCQELAKSSQDRAAELGVPVTTTCYEY